MLLDMGLRLFKSLIIVFLLSALPSNFQVANANEILWEPGIGSFTEAPANLVPGAKMQGISAVVYKSNPDEMILKIQMAESFEDRPFSNNGRYLAMNFYVGKAGCHYIGLINPKCDRVLTISGPENPKSYPLSKSKSIEWVYAYERDADFGPTRVSTNCKSPWWLESTRRSLDTWAFAISITCLGLPKEFNLYGVSQIDLGQKDPAYQATNSVTLNYPFYDLAKNAADRASQNTSRAGKMTEVCETFIRNANSSAWEPYLECETKNSVDLGFCSAHPRADLQTYKNGKWIKIKTMRGKKSDGNCNENPFSFTHVVNFKTPFEQEYRFKEYGNSKLKISYYYIKVSQKLVAD